MLFFYIQHKGGMWVNQVLPQGIFLKNSSVTLFLYSLDTEVSDFFNSKASQKNRELDNRGL